MQTQAINVDSETAAEQYRAYLRDRHYDTPIDKEIRRTYRALAKGQTVIQAIASVAAAGAYTSGRREDIGMPKLGLVRADFTHLRCARQKDGSFVQVPDGVANHGQAAKGKRFTWPAETLPRMDDPISRGGWWIERRALVPIIPLHLRPRRALAGYHILFEAEWSPVVPKDPLLLKRLGDGDLWLVVAAWDLTEVERAALATRVRPN